mgnify:CR=1 FL=1
MPTWLPARREFKGVALPLSLALLALFLVRTVFHGSAWISDIVVAIGLGALVLNSPIARMIGLNIAGGREGDPYERGLRYTGKWLLRLAIILMGLKVRTDIIDTEFFFQIVLLLSFTLPVTFFVAHTVAGLLGLRREIADLIAIGTMVCGASAINALAPVVYARRRDQGLAVATVFLFSVVALLTFVPVGTTVGLNSESAGLWAGVAVNDLSSSVAVGRQFGGDESLIATMAKAIRILLLGPLLIGFSLLRRQSPAEGSARLRFAAHLPFFLIGYILMFGVRLLGDALISGDGTDSGTWTTLLEINDIVVNVAIMTVCAAIGLQIHVRRLIDTGWRVALVGGATWIATAGLSLGLLIASLQDHTTFGMLGGFTMLVVTFLAFQRWRPRPVTLHDSIVEGEPLTLREAVDLVDLLDRDASMTTGIARSILQQVQPAIGELVPLRQSPIQGGINYRRLTLWRSRDHGSSLVGIVWTPGQTAHIHSHDYSAVCRRIEGTIEVTDFTRIADDRLCVLRHAQLGASAVTEFTEGETIHVVRNNGSQDAIDLHYCSPRGDSTALRYEPKDTRQSFTVGEEIDVTTVADCLPVLMSPLAD